METKLTKKYGLLTAICMVVGIVIGSGIFFKASKVLNNVGGNIGKSLLVVGIGRRDNDNLLARFCYAKQ